MRAFSDSRLKALKLNTTNFKVATNKDSITGNQIYKCQQQPPQLSVADRHFSPFADPDFADFTSEASIPPTKMY